MKYIAFILVAISLASTQGCFSSSDSVDSKGQASQAYAGMTSEEQLRTRITERWEALIKMDMAAVYSFATPTYRATYDLRHLQGQYAGQIQRKRIEIESIEIDEDDSAAKANVVVWAETSGFGGAPLEISTISKGAWIKSDGLWWYVEPR